MIVTQKTQVNNGRNIFSFVRSKKGCSKSYTAYASLKCGSGTIRKYWNYLENLSENEFLFEPNNDVEALVTRNPYSRLVSFYLDKVKGRLSEKWIEERYEYDFDRFLLKWKYGKTPPRQCSFLYNFLEGAETDKLFYFLSLGHRTDYTHDPKTKQGVVKYSTQTNTNIQHKLFEYLTQEIPDDVDFKSFVKIYAAFSVDMNRVMESNDQSILNMFHPNTPFYRHLEPHLSSQVLQLGVPENIRESYTHVLRCETLDDDMKKLFDDLGVKFPNILAENKSPEYDYRDFYDDETIDLVGQAYSQDIELLGYNFDVVKQ